MSVPDQSPAPSVAGEVTSGGRSPAILVPVEAGPGGSRALGVARALAELEGGSVHLVHAADRARPAREVVGRLGLSPEALYGTVLDEVAGPSPEALLRRAAEAPAARIVLCNEGGEAGLSPEVARVIAEAECPVIAVGRRCGESPWSLRRVLLPHDGSPLTSTALRLPLRLARIAEAAVFVLHVADLFGPRGPGALPIPTYVDQPQHEWDQWAREFLGRIEVFWDIAASSHPQLLLTRGEPGEEVVRFAVRRQIDLIGLGFRGNAEGERAATLRQVLAWAPCPVLIQRVDEAGFWSTCYPVPVAGPPSGAL